MNKVKDILLGAFCLIASMFTLLLAFQYVIPSPWYIKFMVCVFFCVSNDMFYYAMRKFFPSYD